jgi:hypothetical protein
MKNWFENNKKWLLISGGAFLAGLGIYKFFTMDISEE